MGRRDSHGYQLYNVFLIVSMQHQYAMELLKPKRILNTTLNYDFHTHTHTHTKLVSLYLSQNRRKRVLLPLQGQKQGGKS